MDVNETAAINLLVTLRMGEAVAMFDRSLALMKASAVRWATEVKFILSSAITTPFAGAGAAGVLRTSTMLPGVPAAAVSRRPLDVVNAVAAVTGIRGGSPAVTSVVSDAMKNGVQEIGRFREEFEKTTLELNRRGGIWSRTFQMFANQFGYTGQQAAVLQKNLKDLALIGGIVAGAFAIVGVGLGYLGKILFDITKKTADMGEAIHDASERAGVGAEEMSALQYAAEQSGSSFEHVIGSVAKFSVLMGDAKNQNVKAQETLAKYGITAKDTDEALKQALKTIADMTDHDKKAAAAKALFRERTAEILPVIESFKGDLPGLIEYLRRYNLLIGPKAAEDADRFNDKLYQLERQFKGVRNELGTELMPVMERFMDKISNFLEENPGKVKTWAEKVAQWIEMIALTLRDTVSLLEFFQEAMTLDVFDARARAAFTKKWDEYNLESRRDWENIGVHHPHPATREQIEGRPPYRPTPRPEDENPLLGGTPTGAPEFKLSSRGRALVNAAETLGISPLDLATIISFETAGTMSPAARNKYGYLGLIQFSPENQRRYRVTPGQSFENQVQTSVVEYLQDAFKKKGMTTQGASLQELYLSIFTGSPLGSLYTTDAFKNNAFGNLRRMLSENRPAVLEQMFGGNMGLATGSGVAGDMAKIARDYSDAITAAARLKDLLASVAEAFRSGIAPSEDVIEDYAKYLTQQAQLPAGQRAKGLPRGLGIERGLQPTVEQVQRLFSGLRPVQPGFGLEQEPSARLLTAQQQYYGELTKTLNIEERRTQLKLREAGLQDEINARIVDYTTSLREATVQQKVDLALVEARNTDWEAILAKQSDETQMRREAKDLAVALKTLEAENADANFVAMRRRNLITGEQYKLEKDISELQDRLATSGVNDQLIIQRELLKDILEIRQREIQAVIVTNRAQLEITRQGEYSATEANARVLDFMASQKGVSELMGDFKIGMLETGYDLIDRGLTKVLGKMGVFGQMIRDITAGFLRLLLNKAFRVLFGMDESRPTTLGAPSGGAFGGIGQVLQQILFGRTQAGTATTAAGMAGVGAFGTVGALGAPLLGMHELATAASNPFADLSGIGAHLGGTLGTIGTTVGAAGVHGAADITGAVGTAGGLFGKSAIGKFLQSPQFMGAVLGGALGMQLGQGSIAGSILSGTGGMIAGTLLTGLATSGGSIAGATTGGIFGHTAGLFELSGAATFGIGLAIAGAMMLFGWLFGRSARAKAERNSVNTMAGDALQKIQRLIDDVKHFKIDGKSAYEQGTAIRDDFQKQISQLKSGSAKKLANQKLSEINAALANLKSEGDRADNMRAYAEKIDQSVVPTFQSGGFSGLSYGSRLVTMHAPEVILNTSQIAAVGGYKRLAQIGVPGVNFSGAPEGFANDRAFVKRPSVNGSSSSGERPIYVIATFSDEAAEQIFQKVSPLATAKKVRIATHTDNDGGLLDTIEQKLMFR